MPLPLLHSKLIFPMVLLENKKTRRAEDEESFTGQCHIGCSIQKVKIKSNSVIYVLPDEILYERTGL